MELGEKLKQARLEARLSQRQLCGEKITRNMLSQIENGSAKPSMETLRYLASRLGKPVSYFLDETAVTSPNQETMAAAKTAWAHENWEEVLRILETYRTPDPVFDEECQLLNRLAALALAKDAAEQGRRPYAVQLLERLGRIETGYCAQELEHRRLLLLAKTDPKRRREVCRALPGLDEELLLRARDALDRGSFDRAEHLLEAAEDQAHPDWNFLRGEVYLTRQQYAQAAVCYHKAEAEYPEKTAPRLERCYRELGDFKQAYEYACRQR